MNWYTTAEKVHREGPVPKPGLQLCWSGPWDLAFQTTKATLDHASWMGKNCINNSSWSGLTVSQVRRVSRVSVTVPQKELREVTSFTQPSSLLERCKCQEVLCGDWRTLPQWTFVNPPCPSLKQAGSSDRQNQLTQRMLRFFMGRQPIYLVPQFPLKMKDFNYFPLSFYVFCSEQTRKQRGKECEWIDCETVNPQRSRKRST